MAKNTTYVLGMFPYPSGDGLHVGHVRIYTACDVMTRYFRKKGQEVLSPMGWDAFGLPAENAAIKQQKNPLDMVTANQQNFKRQMQALRFDFDWEHEFSTTDPDYYQFTQWLFLKLFNTLDQQGRRLVYKENVPINWCPKCKTGLANEEVLADGSHERCGSIVGKKLLPQWVMRITSFAEDLLKGLDEGLDWPPGILEMQRNWIGKKEGMVLYHQVKDMDLKLDAFSAYPAWLFADTFMVIAPEHPLVNKLVDGTEYETPVKNFIKECSEITEQQKLEDKFEKKGAFTGRYVLDPFNNNREMPVWVANFAMMGFGTGIIRCSAHDPRDFEFAQKYKIPLKEVVERTDSNLPVHAHTNEGILLDSGPFTGQVISRELINKIKDWIVDQGIGRKKVTYHLRDWVFSRQRYWGEPIPLIHCPKCGEVPLPETSLPLTLPYLKSYEPTDTGESPLTRVEEWKHTTCPKCGEPAERETDTMPNWAGSCWYFLAFPFWTSNKTKFSFPHSNFPITDYWMTTIKPIIDKWLPVDWYLGGAEHAVLHLLYARFWTRVLKQLGLVDFAEPFTRLCGVGMVLAEDGRKMSKSWGNVINPDEMITKYGTDAVRLYEMFMGPWNQAISWDTRALVGQQRFVVKIRQIITIQTQNPNPLITAKLAKLIKDVEADILNQKFNTAIAGMMEFINFIKTQKGMGSNETKAFLAILSIFAPDTAELLWQQQGLKGTAAAAPWPVINISSAENINFLIVIQVNGKLRGTVTVDNNRLLSLNQEQVIELVKKESGVNKWLNPGIKKIIYIPPTPQKQGTINFVV